MRPLAFNVIFAVVGLNPLSCCLLFILFFHPLSLSFCLLLGCVFSRDSLVSFTDLLAVTPYVSGVGALTVVKSEIYTQLLTPSGLPCPSVPTGASVPDPEDG